MVEKALVERMGESHSVTLKAVQLVLAALQSRGTRMTQFIHAEFGGMSQRSPWMSMVGDMFNTQLTSRLDAFAGGKMTKTPSNLEPKSVTKAERGARKAFRHVAAKGAMAELVTAEKAFAKNRERLKAERLAREASAAAPAIKPKPKRR
jgi:hypothetical protein